jgi:Mrp family chromosome partitioning ATPase
MISNRLKINLNRYISTTPFTNQKSISEHQKKMMAKSLPKKRDINGVKHIICVGSGKGGVGKVTTLKDLKIKLKTIIHSIDVV